MASVVRPSLLRQTAGISAPAKRLLYTRTPSSAFAALSKGSAFLGRQDMFRNAAMRKAMGVAAFHASSRQAILPAGPQRITGTVNDPAPIPPTSPTHGSYHWTFERLGALSLIPLTVAPFAAGSLNPTTDALLCAVVLIHSHIGFEACVVDYIPKHRVPKARTFFNWLLRFATLTAGVGLYELETNDVGLTEYMKRVWKA